LPVVKFPTDEDLHAAFGPYVAAIGKVVHAWNYLHEKLGQLFVVVVGTERAITLGIWYSTRSDRAQRNMLRAAVLASPGDRWKPRLLTVREDMLWLLDQADSLAEQRNNAVHIPCAAATDEHGTEMVAAFFGSNPRVHKLRGIRLLDEFAWCERSAEILTRYTMGLETTITFDTYPCPRRPPLPTRRQAQPPKGKKRTLNVHSCDDPNLAMVQHGIL
jgi:hypothetical protein